MAGFNLGAFAGGIGAGIEQGQEIKERYRKMAEEAVARRAQDAVSHWLDPSSAPPPTMPGSPGAAPTNVAIPGAQPIAPAGPTGMMPPPPGAGAPSAAPAGAGGPPGANMPAPAPAPTPRPAAPPAAPPPGGPPAAGPMGKSDGGLPPPGSPNNDDPVLQSKATLQAIAKEIAQANPGRKWGRGELLDAVSDVLEQMDKVNPIAKQIAQLQLQYYKTQVGADTATANRQERGREADQRVSTQEDSIKERWAAVQASNTSREKIAAARDATTMQAASLRAATQEDIAGKMIDFKQQALDAGLDEKVWQAQLTAKLKEQGMSDAFITKVFGSQASNAPQGQPPTAPKREKIATLAAPPPRRTAGATAASAGGPPPIPPTTEGMKATSPTGQGWVVKGGKWVQQGAPK